MVAKALNEGGSGRRERIRGEEVGNEARRGVVGEEREVEEGGGRTRE